MKWICIFLSLKEGNISSGLRPPTPLSPPSENTLYCKILIYTTTSTIIAVSINVTVLHWMFKCMCDVHIYGFWALIQVGKEESS